jgi:hypothetical protein
LIGCNKAGRLAEPMEDAGSLDEARHDGTREVPVRPQQETDP